MPVRAYAHFTSNPLVLFACGERVIAWGHRTSENSHVFTFNRWYCLWSSTHTTHTTHSIIVGPFLDLSDWFFHVLSTHPSYCTFFVPICVFIMRPHRLPLYSLTILQSAIHIFMRWMAINYDYSCFNMNYGLFSLFCCMFRLWSVSRSPANTNWTNIRE